jgi:ATP-dependent helicase/nuclease subunit A
VAPGGLGRFRRGDLVHRLLQQLPDVAPEGRWEAAERMLGRERDLTPDQRAEIAAAAFGVLQDDRFAEVFGPGSRAEVALAGGAPDLPAGLKVSGRIDRLVVTPSRVLVADYKSNRPSPDRVEDADEAYLVQMSVYVAVLRAIFPGRTIEAALVWTDGPKLMVLPDELVETTLTRLRRSG